MSIQTRSNRRDFVKGLSGALASGAGIATLAQLGMIPRAHAQSAGYKALVCIYLAGANDSYNWLMPRDSTNPGSRYDTYRGSRGGVYGTTNTSGLAHDFSTLLPINPASGGNYGLHPAHTDFTVGTQAHSGLQSLFNQGKLAFVCNAGPLVAPITKAQYNAGTVAKPPQLFSHNDQENLWQLGFSDIRSPLARTGWGGRLAETVGSSLSNGLSPTISVAGASRYLIGNSVVPYQLASSGIDTLNQYSATSGGNFQSARRAVLDDLLNDAIASPHGREYARIMSRSLSVGEDLSARLAGASGTIATQFVQGESLSAQLQMVARLIKIARADLSAQRQVYFVRFGSFDLHDGMFVAGQPIATSGHGALLTELNNAVGAFWTALGEIGARSEVTTFTMSDFARTLSGNGNGSDHAWGGNMMVLGDAVNGNRLFGRYPDLIVNNDDTANSDYSFSRGQYIPTTSVNQIGATLARWMGVTDSNVLGAMFPQLDNFSSSNLGFMQGT